MPIDGACDLTDDLRKTGLAMEWKKWAVEWPSYRLTEPDRSELLL
jgi:hypothetical protein